VSGCINYFEALSIYNASNVQNSINLVSGYPLLSDVFGNDLVVLYHPGFP
jgi:hypothetical protein